MLTWASDFNVSPMGIWPMAKHDLRIQVLKLTPRDAQERFLLGRSNGFQHGLLTHGGYYGGSMDFLSSEQFSEGFEQLDDVNWQSADYGRHGIDSEAVDGEVGCVGDNRGSTRPLFSPEDEMSPQLYLED